MKKEKEFSFIELTKKLDYYAMKILVAKVQKQFSEESILWSELSEMLKTYSKMASFQSSVLSIVAFQSKNKIEQQVPNL